MGRNWSLALAALVSLAATSGFAQQREFPFEGELILDARPMPGSKRIPNMDIDAKGMIAVEMWCDRVEGQVIVAGNTITVMTGPPSGRTCPPDRAQRDAEFIEALNAVTSWGRQDDVVRFVGPKTLTFRVPTN
jgi:heat shock protein HslJ